MQRLACGQALNLQLPGCAEEPTTVVLQRAGFADITTTISATTEPDEIRVTPASQPARGVWRLQVTTPCGCYSAQIAVDACKPIGFSPTHSASREPGLVTVCCDSELWDCPT